MTVDELKTELQQRGVPPFAYSVGSDLNEAYCLIQTSDGWHVYYSERGNRNSERVCSTEDEACAELLRLVLNDGAVIRWMERRGLR